MNNVRHIQPQATRHLRTFTVTIAGHERHDGEAPFTYCMKARTQQEAIQTAIAHHSAEMDQDEIDDLIVIESETYPGKPRGGYHWNDLREKQPGTS
jgi:hypothetical protein